MERERRKTALRVENPPTSVSPLPEGWPWSTGKTVSDEVVKDAKDKLRVLELEREILSYAIRRLYEAQAEGKITVEERDSLILKYREDLERVKQEIARGESIIALNELERMQEEFIKMFSERFETLNRRIEELRTITRLAPSTAELPVKSKEAAREKEEEQPEKVPAPRRKREGAKPKSITEQPSPEKEEREEDEADKRIEQIMAEVEKVLSRLSQIEIGE
jgi:hypothetical protein